MRFYCTVVYFAVSIHVWTLKSQAEKVSPAYIFTKNITWQDATEKCQMVGLEKTVNISSPYSGLSWINVTAAYSTWVEYLGCLDVAKEKFAKHVNMKHGTTLLACIESCQQYFFIGIQNKMCVCLQNISLTNESVNGQCSTTIPSICFNDDKAICAFVDSDPLTQHLAVYKKVNISTRPGGECLVVQRFLTEPYIHYDALDCLTESFPTCLHGLDGDDSDSQKTKEKNWIESIALCDRRGLKHIARLSQILINSSSHTLEVNKKYWVANTRRLIKQFPPADDPEFCMAVLVQENGKIQMFPRRCDLHLPVLCSGTEKSMIHTKKDDESNNKELLIAVLVITSVMTVAIAAVIFVLYMRLRKKSSNAGDLPIDSNTDVVYAEVNKSTRSPANQEQNRKHTPGQSDCDETYDHTNHNRLRQNQSPNESDYDTMQGTGIEGESNYDLSYEPEREKLFLVDDSAEYSHVEVENHELKDVSMVQ